MNAKLNFTWENAENRFEWIANYTHMMTQKKSNRSLVAGHKVMKRGNQYQVKLFGNRAPYGWMSAEQLYEYMRRNDLNYFVSQAEDIRIELYLLSQKVH